MTTKANVKSFEESFEGVEYALVDCAEAESAATARGLVLRLIGSPFKSKAAAIRRVQKNTDKMAKGPGLPGGLVVSLPDGKFQGSIVSRIGQDLSLPDASSNVKRFSALASERITALLQAAVGQRADTKSLRKERRGVASQAADITEKRNGIIKSEVAAGRGTKESSVGYKIEACQRITILERDLDRVRAKLTTLSVDIERASRGAKKSCDQMHEQIAAASRGDGLFEAGA